MEAIEIDIINLQEGDEFWGDKTSQQGTLTPRLVSGSLMYWRALGGAMRQRIDPGYDDNDDIVRAQVEWLDGGRESRTWPLGVKIWVRRA